MIQINLLFFFLSLIFACGIQAEVLFELDFSKANGNVETWFKQQKWEFKESMEDMNPRFENGTLIIEPKDDDLGVISTEFEKDKFIKNAKRIRIEWGVEQYANGADWTGPKEKSRNTREPISFMVFFGKEKIDSGSTFVPNLPYFISLFLGEKEKPGQVYYGNYWQKGGRYLCEPCDGSTGKTFVTEVDLAQKFQEFFAKPAPVITAFSIEVDAQKTQPGTNGKYSKAFIKKIQIFDN